MQHARFKNTVSILTAAAATAFTASASAWVNPLEHRYVAGTMNVCDQGAFFVGGVPKVTNYANSSVAGAPQQITIGQSYVQFQIPKKRRQWPLVMIHGSTHTGAALDATPDGREGWFAYAVRNNLATFIMDQPGRGRSGFDASVLHEAKGTGNLAMIPEFGRITDNGAWTTWFGHIIPAGTNIVTGTMIRHGDPGDPHPPEDFSNPSEAHGNYPPAFPIPPLPNSIDPAIAARTGAIGEAPNPVNNDYLALEYYKQLVPNAEATLPGSICPTCTPTTQSGANTWSPRAMANLVEGLGGAIVSPHSQSTIQGMHFVRIMKERGKLNLIKGILMPEGAAPIASSGLTASDFDNIPFLLINGDYRPVATPVSGRAQSRADIAEMNSSPTSNAKHEYVDMETVGSQFYGQSHMNMLGTSSIAMFDFFLQWASQHIDNPPAATKCP